MIGASIGMCVLSMSSTFFQDTFESLIKEPAERFGEDLRWLDETFDRIYRGVRGGC